MIVRIYDCLSINEYVCVWMCECVWECVCVCVCALLCFNVLLYDCMTVWICDCVICVTMQIKISSNIMSLWLWNNVIVPWFENIYVIRMTLLFYWKQMVCFWNEWFCFRTHDFVFEKNVFVFETNVFVFETNDLFSTRCLRFPRGAFSFWFCSTACLIFKSQPWCVPKNRRYLFTQPTHAPPSSIPKITTLAWP